MKLLKKYLQHNYKLWKEQLKQELNNRTLIKTKKLCFHKWEIIHDIDIEPGEPGISYTYKKCKKCNIHGNKDNCSSNSLGGLKDWEKENQMKIQKLQGLIKEFKLLNN